MLLLLVLLLVLLLLLLLARLPSAFSLSAPSFTALTFRSCQEGKVNGIPLVVDICLCLSGTEARK
jgi:hypothetical protein